MYKKANHSTPLLRFCRNTSFCLFFLALFLLLAFSQAQAADVTLGWDKNAEPSVTGYKVFYKSGTSGAPYNGTLLDQGGSPVNLPVANLSDPANPKVTLTGLQEGVKYYFVATAYDNAGNESGYSNEVYYAVPAQQADTVAPTVPGAFSAKAINSSTAYMAWQGSTDAGGSGLAGYRIYRNGVEIATTTEGGYTDSRLQAATDYQYTVKAYDKAGNISAASATSTATTLAQSSTAIRVNCGGGNYIDASGNQWVADKGFNTGSTSTSANAIKRTEDDIIYQTKRLDPSALPGLIYSFSVPAAQYRVNLYFADTVNADLRVFDINIEGVQVINDLDISGTVSANAAMLKAVDLEVTDGQINIEFKRSVSDPIISGIEILSQGPATPTTHTISASAGSFGSITPSGTVTVNHGANQTFAIAANANYHISNVQVDGQAMGPIATHTFTNVTANHTISASFAINTYTLTSTANANGSIQPSGTVTAAHGASQTFAISAASNYHVKDVVVDGVSAGPVASYIFTNLNKNHSITATFEIDSYTITASTGEHGSITPTGAVLVNRGSSKTFSIAANNHYVISDVRVDGQSIGSPASYTFTKVTANHQISATFKPKTYTITAAACEDGSIAPAGATSVTYGNSQTYTLTANEHCKLVDVRVDGASVGAVSTYSFSNASADHTIEALFEKVNQPPVADAGPDQTVDEGAIVTLSGYNSEDPDDGIVSYQWEQIGGPTVALSDPSAEEAHFMAPDVNVEGAALVFRLTVTDVSGLKAQDTSIVNVTWVNLPPNAETGPDMTVNEGQIVTLDGSSSSDPDDGIASYRWVQISGQPIKLSAYDAIRPSFTAPDVDPQGAALRFELTVTDRGGLKATSQCIVNISWINDPPIAEAGPNQTVVEGSEVTLDGSNSMDTDDGIASYTWTQTEGMPVTLSDASAVQPVFTVPNVEADGAALTFKLTVTDKGGLKAQDTCIVNLTWKNEAPTADAGEDQVVSEGQLVTLDGAKSSDPDDGVQSYQWCQVSGKTVTLVDAGSVQPSFKAPDVGPEGEALTFKLTVADSGGLQAQDTCIVNVTWQNQSPVANAGPNQSVHSGAHVSLDGSKSSDPDDGIGSYHWTQIEGIPVTLSDPAAVNPSFMAPVSIDQDTVLVFTLTVTDKGGLQHADTCVISVMHQPVVEPDSQAPAISITGPTSAATYKTSETTVKLTGTASDNVAVVKVSWTNAQGGSGLASGTSNWYSGPIALKMGENRISVSATDAAGNAKTAILTVTRVLPPDTKAPELRVISPTSESFYFTTKSSVTLKGTCSDDTKVKTVKWSNSMGRSGIAVGTAQWTINNMFVKKWFTTVTITASDTAGNQVTKEITIFRWPY